MTLLEFLAYPYDFKGFEDVKKQISAHVAKNYQDYLSLLERFYELTGKKDKISGQITGYRTRIVHLGYELEDILDNDEFAIKRLFMELQRYIGIVITHLIENCHYTWDEFLEFRKQLKISLGLKVN